MSNTAYNIDFEKVDGAFQKLAGSPAGDKALAELSRALDGVTHASGGGLNKQEAHYLITNLVQQRPGHFAPGALTGAAAGKTVHGFAIKTAVP